MGIRKKVIIISSGVLPVPAVKGGAIENLIEIFINENEVSGEFEIILFSIYSDEAFQKSLNYKNCKFEFINQKNIKYKFSRIFRYIINKYSKKYFGNAYINQVIKKLRNQKKESLILIQNKPEFSIRLYGEGYKNIMLHLHNDILNKESKNAMDIVNSCKKIIVVSNFIKDRVEEIKGNLNLKTVYNGIDIERFSKEIDIIKLRELRNRYNIKNSDFVIIYSGRITKSKGVEELVCAFNRLCEKYCCIKLLIIGGVNYSDDTIDEFLEKLKTIKNNNIIYTGYVNYNEINKLYKLGDIGVVPSIETEAAPLTTVEMMANSMPLVISDSGGIKELVDKDCSFMAIRNEKYIESLEQYIEILLNNKNLKDKMAKKAKERSFEFTISKYYENLSRELGEFNEN